jgi:hypothetical protein
MKPSSPKPSNEDPRLTRLCDLAPALPGTTRELRGSHAQFLVRKKTFAYFLSDHHGDGIVSVTCKVLAGDNEGLVEAQPLRFYLPLTSGREAGLLSDWTQAKSIGMKSGNCFWAVIFWWHPHD